MVDDVIEVVSLQHTSTVTTAPAVAASITISTRQQMATTEKKKPKDSSPTGEKIELFIYAIVSKTAGLLFSDKRD